jgi:hypothetical protein
MALVWQPFARGRHRNVPCYAAILPGKFLSATPTASRHYTGSGVEGPFLQFEDRL